MIFPSLSGIEAEVGVSDRFLDHGDLGSVPGLDRDHERLRHVQRGYLVDRRRRAVVIDLDAVEQVDRSTSGADVRHLVLKPGQHLLHAGLRAGFQLL